MQLKKVKRSETHSHLIDMQKSSKWKGYRWRCKYCQKPLKDLFIATRHINKEHQQYER